jgi:hypothetical protein
MWSNLDERAFQLRFAGAKIAIWLINGFWLPTRHSAQNPASGRDIRLRFTRRTMCTKRHLPWCSLRAAFCTAILKKIRPVEPP